jgi:CheY-like chemotaxis protein
MHLDNADQYKRIFIIDDDVEDHEIFMEAVGKVNESIQCFSSTSGEDALRQLQLEVVMLPDLIFLDLNMPRLNGKQILRALKNDRSLKAIPVIMYSTSFAPKDKDEIQQLGAAFQLVKPPRFEDLCASLRFIFSRDWS